LCPAGFTGIQCEAKVDICPNKCSGNGVCDEWTKQCHCKEGFSGPDCSVAGCPKGCNEPNGRCYAGKCYCAPNFTGDDCSQEECPNSCTGNGICDSDKRVCHCNPGWSGHDCSLKTCAGELKDCSNHGLCFNGTCKCNEGYEGKDCATIAGLEEGCSKSCVSQCLKLCSQVYKAKGLAASKTCYTSCNHKCLNNCISTDDNPRAAAVSLATSS
jgi:hypothetical protein